MFNFNLVGRIGVLEMAGTKAGGMKAAATNKAKYGKEFYARIGKKGGQMVTLVGLPLTQHLLVSQALRAVVFHAVALPRKLK